MKKHIARYMIMGIAAVLLLSGTMQMKGEAETMKDIPLSDTETWDKFIYQLKVDDLPMATAESFSCPAVGELSPSFAVGDGCDSVGGN